MTKKKELDIVARTTIVPNAPMWFFSQEGMWQQKGMTAEDVAVKFEKVWGAEAHWSTMEDIEHSIASLTLAEGWRLDHTGRTGHAVIYDAANIHRAQISPSDDGNYFNLYLFPKYTLNSKIDDLNKRVCLSVGNRKINNDHGDNFFPLPDTKDELVRLKEEFMTSRYPDYLDPLAYW